MPPVVLPPLGRYTKSSTPVFKYSGFDPETGVLTAKRLDDLRQAEQLAALKRGHRSERYRLLTAARSVFVEAGARKALQYVHNFHRTAKCSYVPRADIFVHHAPAYNGAFYSGLIACGCVWTCPVCAVKIQERRREEISQAIDWAYKTGYQPAMVTLTFPHQAFHRISELLEKQKLAFQYLRSGARFTRFKTRFSYQSLIRSLELMHGKNGWHPHTHELWFVKRDLPGVENAGSVAAEMKVEILRMWESACRKAGILDDASNLDAFRLHAVDVKGNCSASHYLAKMDDAKHWGADREMAKGTKKASEKGTHPFGLLDKASAGDLRAKRLFLAYAIAIKGKAQIYWSPGFKAKVGIGEKTDAELAEETREEAQVLGQILYPDWKNIRRAEKRASVLTAAEKFGWPGVCEIVEALRRIELPLTPVFAAVNRSPGGGYSREAGPPDPAF